MSPPTKASFYQSPNEEPEEKGDTSKADGKLPPRKASSSGGVDESTEKVIFKRSVLLVIGAFAVMLFLFAVSFFLSVRGAEKTLVPDIVGEELIEGLISLQEKELYPRVQVKYTGDPGDKGLIIAQDPLSGSYVRAGRRVIITVSRGAIIDRVGDYIGKELEELRIHLSTLVSAGKPLLTIQEPVSYQFDEAPAGTILAQEPPPGTEISGPTPLALVVSRGPGETGWVLPDLVGLRAADVLLVLADAPQSFVFELDEDVSPGREVIVRSQEPVSGTEVFSAEPILLRVNRPSAIGEDSVFGFFRYTLPEYPIHVDLEVRYRNPGEEEELLFAMPHSGGEISFPYLAEVGTIYTLTIYGEEQIRHIVKGSD